jgi:hypothetical protein
MRLDLDPIVDELSKKLLPELWSSLQRFKSEKRYLLDNYDVDEIGWEYVNSTENLEACRKLKKSDLLDCLASADHDFLCLPSANFQDDLLDLVIKKLVDQGILLRLADGTYIIQTGKLRKALQACNLNVWAY